MARTRAARRPLSQRTLIWVEGTLCGLLAAVATPMAVLLAGLLLPGFAALVLDRATGKPMARAMFLLGAAASIQPARDLWEVGLSMPAAMQQLTDPVTIGLAWGAGLCGWAIAEVAPLVVSLVLEARCVTRVATLRRMREDLQEEWGFETGVEEDASAV